MKILTKKGYVYAPSSGSKQSLLTKTQPDLSYSVREIVARFSRNLPIDDQYHEAVYIGSDDFDSEDVEKMRYFDLHEIDLSRALLRKKLMDEETKMKQIYLDSLSQKGSEQSNAKDVE